MDEISGPSSEAIEGLLAALRQVHLKMDEFQKSLQGLTLSDRKRSFNPFADGKPTTTEKSLSRIVLESMSHGPAIVANGKIVRVAGNDLAFAMLEDSGGTLLPLNIELGTWPDGTSVGHFDPSWEERPLEITWDPARRMALRFAMLPATAGSDEHQSTGEGRT